MVSSNIRLNQDLDHMEYLGVNIAKIQFQPVEPESQGGRKEMEFNPTF